MNVLFMCLGAFDDLSASSVHLDILKRFARDHEVWLACKHEGKETSLTVESGIHVLRIHTGALKGTGLIRKGINTILLEPQFCKVIKTYLNNVRFDLILYTTPPITFARSIRYIKSRDQSYTYLMLKDIFPQNAVDLGMMTTSGVKGILYRHFRKTEKQLYSLSDTIGCMSPANVDYILRHNPEINSNKVEVCPNITVVEDKSIDAESRKRIREKYSIPQDKKVLVYGGNLGKPQDIPFLKECLKAQHFDKAFFLIIGQGTEYEKLKAFMDHEAPNNCKLMPSLPSDDYETLVAACDVGMIFLDHRFTIPNFPSRILSYMKAKIPVLAITDPNTDIGKIIREGDFGWWCESNSTKNFLQMTERIFNEDLSIKGENGWKYLREHYTPDVAYDAIMQHLNS